MMTRYVVLTSRISHELTLLEMMVEQCERAMERSTQNPADRDLYMAAAALHLHDFYSGVERVLEVIAVDIDDNVPAGRSWHRDLLTQMTLDLPDVRPAVLKLETVQALDEYLRFRHVVRNLYAFQFEMEKLEPLVTQLRATYSCLCVDFEEFTRFLRCMSQADEGDGEGTSGRE